MVDVSTDPSSLRLSACIFSIIGWADTNIANTIVNCCMAAAPSSPITAFMYLTWN